MDYRISKYSNKRPAIQTFDDEGFPDARLTVNLVNENCEKDETFLDTNNVPDAEERLQLLGIKYSNIGSGSSGFCVYPKIKLL